jgi:hypothetical protein
MQSASLSHSLFLCPKNDKTVFALIFVIAIISSLLTIANPGFFSHDEWDKADHVTRYGFAKYVFDYVSLPTTVEFGHPVRPVSFFVQGVAALFMHSYPFVVHLMDVLMHGAVAAMLFVAIRRVNERRQFAWVSTLIFLISPLAALSVAWSAALMDRLYVLFGLIAFIAAYDYINQKREWLGLSAIFIASSMAILSKETALILPATLIVLPLVAVVPLRNKRLWIAFAVWCIPIGMYLLYRAPALANSISGATSNPYSVSLTNVPDGLAVYAIYPFLWLLVEPGNWHLQMAPRIWFAAIAHAALLVMLWRAFSFRVVLAYLAGYILFLVPILPIAAKGAHYLYGSGLIFSMAIAALFMSNWASQRKAVLSVLALMMLMLSIHTLNIQRDMYETGICMNIASKTIESSYLARGSPKEMSIVVDDGAPGLVLLRYSTNREIIGANHLLKMHVFDNTHIIKDANVYRFNASCIVYKK